MAVITARDVARWTQGKIEGLSDLPITSISKIEDVKDDSLCFLANPKYDRYLYIPNKRTVLISGDYELKGKTGATLIRVNNVYESFAVVLDHFDTAIEKPNEIDMLSSIDPKAIVQDGVAVGKFTIIEEGSRVSKDTWIGGQVFIGKQVTIGRECRIMPGVRILDRTVIGDRVTIQSNAVIGSDGFGFAIDGEIYVRIPPQGNVIIEDDVEIGSNTCIDRATLGSTIIRKGAKLDNLIQIAHNVDVGKNVAIAAQTGVSGSSKIGDGSQLGGQSGVVGHISIAPGSRIQAQSGVSTNIYEENKKWYGSPILTYYNYLRSFAIFKRLPDLLKRLDVLEKRIKP